MLERSRALFFSPLRSAYRGGADNRELILKPGMLKIRLGASIGVYLSDTHVSWCVMEKFILGTRQTDAGEEPCTKQDWAEALQRVLQPRAKSLGPSASVVIGLAANHAFYATLPMGATPQPAEALLAEHHCCTSIPAAELSADLLPIKINAKAFAAIGAAKRKELQTLTDVPRKLGFRMVRVEPGPWALLRTCSRNPANRITLRLLIDDRQLLAVLVTGMQPLLWRPMELPEEMPADLISSVVRTFESYASQHLGIGALDSIVLEGKFPDALAQKLKEELGERFSLVDGAALSSAATARGLALGGMDRDKPAPDLARPLAPPPQLWDLVPRGEVALLGATIVCMALWLWACGNGAQSQAERIEAENTRSQVLVASDERLKAEKKTLSAQVQAVSSFLNNRVQWTEYLNQFSSRVPDGIKLVGIQGAYDMPMPNARASTKVKRELALNFTTLVPKNQAAPPEVYKLLQAIRSAPAIVRDLPEIKLSTLRISVSQDLHGHVSAGDPATFTVTCAPKGGNKPVHGGAPGVMGSGAKG